ncbi:MAG: hypothetical protein IJY45_02625 [Tidjanibacter sp.]|nr:hypothetical protein [Tidjanibacter sp.]
MKKLFLMMGVVFGALALTNCTNDIDESIAPETATKEFSLTVSAGDQTRTTIEDFTTSWAAGDQINLFYAPAGTTDYVNAGAFTITAENLADNKFTGTVPADFDTTAAYDWYVIYPYNAALETPANSSVTMTVGQANQAQVGYDSTAHLCGANAPLVGKVENTNAPEITMNHLVSVVELTVYNDLTSPMVVNGVAIEAEQPIGGKYAVGFAEEVEYNIVDEAEGSNKVALTVNGATEIPAGGNAVVYMSVKPFVAEVNETLKFTISTNAGERVIFKALTKQLDFKAGKVKKIGLKASSAGTKVLGDDTFKFLRAIIDGNLMGAQTPVVNDWGSFNVSFPGITIAEVNGKLEVTRIWGAPFTSLPAAIELPELTDFSCNGNANLNGKTLPKTWNTPKLVYANFAWCHMIGNIPEGLASTTPKLVQLFMDNNDFSGAWPHIWASGVNGGTGELEVVIANGGNNGMGYMIPATMDVALNAWVDDNNWDAGHTNTQGDKVQLKVSDSGKYIGFEKGWGQQRYMKYAGGAADDIATWNDKRLVTSDTPGGWTVIPASIPRVMLDWDQAAADAYTKTGLLPGEEPTPMGEGTKAFLKAIVDGKLMGDQTQVVNHWETFNATFPGITITEVNGKLEVTNINGAPFTALPNTINLPELARVELRGCAGLNGKTMPTVWNTPKLQYFCIAACQMTGAFPASFAENTPALHTLFMDGNNFAGAWPHTWASGVNGGTGKLEVVIADGGNSDMGYLVPATLDVKINAWKNSADHSQGNNNANGDLTQIKLGGASGNYSGFEKGWGQERYVTFAGGSASDTATWHEKRSLAGNPDEWAWYFTNLPGVVPTVMLDWDQVAADAYTASKL